MKKKIITTILVTIFCGSLCVPVSARETDALSTSDLQGVDQLDALDDSALKEIEEMGEDADIDIEDMEEEAEEDTENDAVSYNDLLNAIETSTFSDGALSLSDCLSSIGAIDTTFDEMYSLASSGIEVDNIDMGLLNYSYDDLSNSIINTYDSIDLSGLSEGCMQLFSDTYGDVLNNINFQTASIPDGFDINAMLNSASSSINNAYSSATSSGTFGSIKNNISIGDIFAQAAAGPTTTSLSIASSSLDWFNDQTASSNSSMKDQYDSAKKAFYNNYKTEGYDAARKSMESLANYRASSNGYNMIDYGEDGSISYNENNIDELADLGLTYASGMDGLSVDQSHFADDPDNLNAWINEYLIENGQDPTDESARESAENKINRYNNRGDTFPRITEWWREGLGSNNTITKSYKEASGEDVKSGYSIKDLWGDVTTPARNSFLSN